MTKHLFDENTILRTSEIVNENICKKKQSRERSVRTILTKKVIPEAVESDFVIFIIEKAKENGLTISNIRELMERVIVFMEDNSVLPGSCEVSQEGLTFKISPPTECLNRTDTDIARRHAQSSTNALCQKQIF